MPPRWLVRVIEEVRRCGRTRAVDFTANADEELLALDLGLAEQDACDVLSRLSARDFAQRVISSVTGEPMYVFQPHVAGVSLYIKIVLRQRCVVISFHEREAAEDDGDT